MGCIVAHRIMTGDIDGALDRALLKREWTTFEVELVRDACAASRVVMSVEDFVYPEGAPTLRDDPGPR